jgi:uncharacterized protein (TIGR02145 family)
MKKLILFTLILGTVLNSYSQKTGTFKDKRDGKVYKTVKIGTQWWFAENLNFITDRGSWCYNDSLKYCETYGRLYNWNTALKACPKGWHLPYDAEWNKLIDNLGGEIVAGGKMKTTNNWKYATNGNATNESGFSALPSGERNDNESLFYSLGELTCFWSSTPEKDKQAWNHNLFYLYGDINQSTESLRTSGFSVRCLKN